MKSSLACLLVSAFVVPFAWGDPNTDPLAAPGPEAPAPSINIRIEMQVVARPVEAAIPLAADLMYKEKIEGASVKIQDLLAKGVAKLIGWPIITTRSGQMATVQAVEEYRYATQYDPPTVSYTPAADVTEATKIVPRADITHLDGIPTAFQTQNLGLTLEVEPVLSPDGRKIALSLTPRHVRLKETQEGHHRGSPRRATKSRWSNRILTR